MTIDEAHVAAMRGSALLSADGDPALDHVTLTGRSVLLASLLAGHGLRPGDVVALLAEQSTHVYDLMIGVRRAGLVLMVVDPAHSLEQNAFAINTSGALVLVASSTQSSTAQALVPLTPYIKARFGLDGELPGHRSLQLARSAAPVRLAEAPPAGTIHHVIGPSGRPVEVRVPDAAHDDTGRTYTRLMIGDLRLDSETVLVESAPVLTVAAALLGTAVLVAGGSVAVPRTPTGLEVLRSAFSVEASILNLTAAAAAEMIELRADRALRLTPAALECVVVDGGDLGVRDALTRLWGDRVRVVDPDYLGEVALAASDRSVTQAEI